MIEFVPYEAKHFYEVPLGPEQDAWRAMVDPDYSRLIAIPGKSWTGLDGGAVIGCAGFTPFWPGVHRCWALFSPGAPKLWPAIIRRIRREMAALDSRRVEMTVVYGFGNGCRLAHMLGFRVEGLLESYGPDGKDHFMYAAVRK